MTFGIYTYTMVKPRISVIVPTRGRIERLDRMLTSLRNTAASLETVEVVLRCDVDDMSTLHYVVGRNLTFIAGPHLDGYVTLATFINQAARLSTADVVLVINDDAEFVTPGWDTALVNEAAKYPDGIFDLGVDTVMNNDNFVFPCVSRRTVDLIGAHDERLIYNDIWVRDVMAGFGRAIRVPHVTIRHDWFGMTPDQERALSIVTRSGYADLYVSCVREAQEKLASATKEMCV